MKRKILLIALTLPLLASCGRAYRQQMADKALKDAEAREDLTQEIPGIVEVVEELEMTLNEIEQALEGEENSFSENLDNTNNKIKGLENQLYRMESDLMDQAEKLKDVREVYIEPSLEKALEKNSVSDDPASASESSSISENPQD